MQNIELLSIRESEENPLFWYQRVESISFCTRYEPNFLFISDSKQK